MAVVNWLWVQLHAASASGRQPVLLDIGMNSGFFAALAASLGARVFAFEPQPTCISNAALANPAASITMYNYAVSARNATLLVPVAACDPMNTIFQEQSAWHTVHTANLGNLWDLACIGYIDAVKIDVEGSELAVLEALLPLLESKRIGTLFIEIAVPFTTTSSSSLLFQCDTRHTFIWLLTNTQQLSALFYALGWPSLGYSLESGTRFIEKAFRGRYTMEFLYTPEPASATAHCSERTSTAAMGLPSQVDCTGAAAEVFTVTDLTSHLKMGGGNYMFRALP